MIKSTFALEKILWSMGSVIIIAAMLLALVNYWVHLTMLQKELFIVLPLVIIYAFALILSFTHRYPFLRACLYVIFGLMGPLALNILLGNSRVDLPLAALFLMLIPAVFETQKTVQVFCILYVIWIYFIAFPFFPQHGNWLLNKFELSTLGGLFWLMPWVLPESWRKVADSWGRPLGALFLLLAATTGLFMSHYPLYLDWLSLPIGLIVLIFGVLTHNRLIMIELIFFYVVNILGFSAKYFDNLMAWPLILLIIGAGLMVFGYAYLKIRRFLV